MRKYLKLSGYDDDKINIKRFSQHFGKTSTYDDLYSDNNNKNNPPPQMSSNGFNTNSINFKNCNNDNYFNSSVQRNLTSPPQNSQMMKSNPGFSYGTGFKC